MLEFILEKVLRIFADVFFWVVVRVFFGWNSKLERSFGIINIVTFCTVVYCLYQSYDVTAGLFFSLMLVVTYLKLRTAGKIATKNQ